MLQVLNGSTATKLMFLMIDNTDHRTGKTGLTPTVTLSKNGSGFAIPAGSVAEVGLGWYALTPAAADTNTNGLLILHASAAGADDSDTAVSIVAYNPLDAVALGLSRLDAAVSSRLAPGNAAEEAAIANALLDQANGVETNLTGRQALRRAAAALGGVLSGAGTTTVSVQAAGVPATTRITATVDASGNRSALVLTP